MSVRESRTALLLVAAVGLLAGCPEEPDACLWTVSNGVGSVDAPADLAGLFLREPGGDWGDNTLGDAGPLPFGESWSFLVAPGTPTLDLRGVDGEGTSWSRYGAETCVDGERFQTTLTSDDLDVPCTWTITNQVGDSSVNYALLDVWARINGSAEWGGGLLTETLPFGESVEIQVETGWSYDLSAADQDAIFYLALNAVECLDGEDLSTTLTLADEAPPCTWQVTNAIDGDLGPLRITALAVTVSGTGQTQVYELTNALNFGDTTDVPFFPRALWDLQAIDELGQTYSYPESALCLDGGELYALDVVWEHVD